MTTQQLVPEKVTTWSIALAVILIAFGLLALALPMFTSIGVVRVLAWIVVFNGIFQLAYAFRSHGVGRVAWKFLVAVLYVMAGMWLLFHPLIGVVTLTLLLGGFFLAEGIMDLAGYFFALKNGLRSGSSWMLLDGIITIILAAMIWQQWPSSSLWVLGTLVGVSLLMTGTTRLMLALAVRRLAKADQFGVVQGQSRAA
jgi:uncharacterized membrane protein HdeD (DUF308 family)